MRAIGLQDDVNEQQASRQAIVNVPMMRKQVSVRLLGQNSNEGEVDFLSEGRCPKIVKAGVLAPRRMMAPATILERNISCFSSL